MKTIPRIAAVAALFFIIGSNLARAGDSVVAPPPVGDKETHTLFGDTYWFLDGRLRYEYADQSGRADSNALTWRNRAGIQTGEWAGLSALAELEHTWALLGEDHYNPFPRAGRTVIADPENIELNRLQVDYRTDIWDTLVTVGRQRITLGDQRFIGNVGWRQNEQTFDAARLQVQPVTGVKLDYSYLARVNRIFGEQAPTSTLTRFESDSHLLNVHLGPLVAFAYLLDLENAEALSSQTYGLRFNGSQGLGGSAALLLDLQWAVQQDYASNASDYTAQYYHVEGGIDLDKSLQFGLGYEKLGEDNGSAFQTPLGTNHKFNGFADAFLITPASGLQDIYAFVGGKLPGGFKARLGYHHFLTDAGNDQLGNELDLTVGHKIGEKASALVKAAYLEGDGVQPDIQRVSFQVDYKF